MIGARDLVWSMALCAIMIVLFQCRPAWEMQRFIERESEVGFLEAYAGHRRLPSGEVITPPGRGVTVDPSASAVTFRRLEIAAEQMSWSGSKAEIVARHAVELESGDASHEVHVKLEKEAGHWRYTSFVVRGQGALADPNSGNPWLRALRMGDGT